MTSTEPMGSFVASAIILTTLFVLIVAATKPPERSKMRALLSNRDWRACQNLHLAGRAIDTCIEERAAEAASPQSKALNK
jgi:hypothetical protein